MRNRLEKLKEKEGRDSLRDYTIDTILDAENIESWLNDLLQHGCVSGMVGSLIYYKDTVQFYDEHENEIENLLDETRKDNNFDNRFEMIASLNGADNVGSMDQEKNLLSWFAFEETARQLANEIGLEV